MVRGASSEASGEVVVVWAYTGLFTGPSGGGWDVGACLPRSSDLGPGIWPDIERRGEIHRGTQSCRLTDPM